MMIATILILQILTTSGLSWLLLRPRRESAVCGHTSPANDLGDTHKCVLPLGHEGSHADTFASMDESLHGYFWKDVPFVVDRAPNHVVDVTNMIEPVTFDRLEEDDAPAIEVTFDESKNETALILHQDGRTVSFLGCWAGIRYFLSGAMVRLDSVSTERTRAEQTKVMGNMS